MRYGPSCGFDATRTSPFGYYATCHCGWVSPAYVESHEAAWRTYQTHREATP